MDRLPNRRLLFVALMLIVAGCSSYSYLKVAHLSPAQLKEISDPELCNAFNHTRAEPRTRQSVIREEMKARTLLTDTEWELVDRKQVQTGMSKLALIACWGFPKRATRGMPAVSDSLINYEQYIYDGSAGWSQVSVYLENDIVTDWREWSEVTPEEIEKSLPGVHTRAPGVASEKPPGFEPPSQEPQKDGQTMPGPR